MKAKIRTCPFDNCPCELSCPDRHPDRSGCKLTDTLDAGQDALVFNNPTGEVLLFFHDGRVSQMPAIIASVPQEMVEKLQFPEKTALDSNRS